MSCFIKWYKICWFPAGDINASDGGNIGAAAHSDYGMLTLLATDGTPGLQAW